MNRSFKLIASGWVLLLFSALLTSCGNNTPKTEKEPDAKEIADEHNDAKFHDNALEKNADYISNAYSSGLCEIEAAKRAKEYASAKQTRDLASELIAAHVRLNDRIQALARSKQVSLQNGLTAEQLDDLKKHSDQKGVEYDKAYLSDVISKHEKSIAMFEKAADASEDADVRKLFSDALPELRNHLDMAMNTKNKLK